MALTYLGTSVPATAGIGDDPYQTNFSYWYAVHNPIILKFQREDFVIASVTDDGSGNAKVTLSSPDATKIGLLAFGQSIYINASNSGGTVKYTGIYTVIDTDNSTYITIATAFLGDAAQSGSFINANDALVGYYGEFKIFSSTETIQIARFVPLYDGILTVDISGYVRRMLPLVDQHIYDPSNAMEIDSALSIGVYADKRERYNDEPSVPAFSNYLSKIYCVNGAKQLGDEFGQNMALYVPFSDSSEWLSKFLTFFDELTFWMGYPFELAAIISIEVIAIYDGHFVLDIIHQPGGQEVASSIDPDTPGVYRFNIGDDTVTYATAIADYITVQIISDGTPRDDAFTEAKKINVRQCQQNSIYLKWLNTLGGWSYWMFEFDQQKAVAVSEAKTFQQYIEDLATADSALQYLSKRAFPKMTIGADGVSDSNLLGLKGILFSPKVMWLTNPDTWAIKDGAKWQTVLVNPGSFNLESTREGFCNVEMTIEFPEINIQTQ